MKLVFFILMIVEFVYVNSYSQTRINSFDIEGNEHFTSFDVRNMMVSKKDGIFKREQFDLDLMTVREKYKSEGFLYVKFDEEKLEFSEDSALVDIYIKINEGDKITIGDIEIDGNRSISDEEILNVFSTKKDEVLDDDKLNEDLNELLKLYESRDLPFVKIKVNDITVYKDNNLNKIRIELKVDENSKVKISQVKITGNEFTDDDVILREIKLNKNKYLTSNTLSEIEDRLDKLNIFEVIDEPKIYTLKNKNESGLLINVKEGNTNTFDGILGYNPPQGQEESGYLTGLVNVSFRNLFGTGRKLEAKYQQEVRETQELEFRYFEPYFFNYPLNINFGFLQRIQDSTYTRRNIGIKGDFLFSDYFTLSLIGNYERVIPSDIPQSSFVIADSRILASGLEIKYDSRDNIYIPLKGILYKSVYTYGSKSIFNSDQLQNLGYDDSYSIQKYYVDLDFYFSMFNRQSNLIKLFGGEVRSDKLEDSDYFRIGGNKYIRGYRNEQFLASKLVSSNLELRYSVSRKGFLFTFFDAGYYFKPADEINHYPEQEGFLYGYGFGIRLESALGIIGVSYALGKNADILDGIINFGLINEF
ncbi:MAG: Outer membrane protein assembly factor BamA [Ignavibacteria bacterium]|nr:Outer membrane protein assembly factor BamA [Ignavibacteria bacterium]